MQVVLKARNTGLDCLMSSLKEFGDGKVLAIPSFILTGFQGNRLTAVAVRIASVFMPILITIGTITLAMQISDHCVKRAEKRRLK